MSNTKQEMLFGIGWLIVGLATVVAGQVSIGIVMGAFGVFILAYTRAKAHKRRREP